MKKLILTLLILAVLILSGCKGNVTGGTIICNKPYILVGNDCCLDKNDNAICDKDEIEEKPVEAVEPPKEEIVEEVVEEPKEEIKEETPVQSPGEYTVKEGDIITFEGKKIEIKSIDFFQGKLEVTIAFDGIERAVYDTRTPEIINDLKIQTLKFDQLKNSIILKIERFELGLDEYLVDTRTTLKLFGKEIKIGNILDDGAIIFDVQKGDEIDTKLHLDEGESLTVQGIIITNIEGFPRLTSGIKIEKYAIIKIQQ